MLDELLLKIEPVAKELEKLRGRASVSLFCAYGSTDGVEILELPSALIERIVALRLTLSIFPCPMETGKEEGLGRIAS